MASVFTKVIKKEENLSEFLCVDYYDKVSNFLDAIRALNRVAHELQVNTNLRK
jgi:hypothetical protein